MTEIASTGQLVSYEEFVLVGEPLCEGLRMLTQHEQLITMATWQHMETWQHVYWPTNNYGGQPGKTGLDETGNCRAPVMILQNRPVVVEN